MAVWTLAAVLALAGCARGEQAEEDVDRMVAEAKAGYLAHWDRYDAAAATGFTDAELVSQLEAGAGGETRERLRQEIEAFAAGKGQVDDGGSTIGELEVVSVNPPEEDGEGLAVDLDTCVRLEGTLRDADGAVVRELAVEGPTFLRARMVDDDGVWRLVSQVPHGSRCPDELRPAG